MHEERAKFELGVTFHHFFPYMVAEFGKSQRLHDNLRIWEPCQIKVINADGVSFL